MTATNSIREIAIIGAGIGGLALAIGLRNAKVPFHIYEAASEFSAIGAGISFGPNAISALQAIEPELRRLFGTISMGNENPAKDNVFFDLLLAEPGLGLSQYGEGLPVACANYKKCSAHRKDLLDIMKSLIPEGSVTFKKRAASVKQEGSQVKVNFLDGTSITASAVVGCDGGKGASRRAVLVDHPEHIPATYSNRYVYRTVIPMADARRILGPLAGDGQMMMGKGVYFTSYPMSGSRELNFLAAKENPEPWTQPEWTAEVSREAMLDDFEGFDSRLLEALSYVAPPIRWALFHHASTPTYARGLTCLLGDSAHASTPHQGAAAGQCLEDAVILSRLLGAAFKNGSPDISAAFEIYDLIRRPRGQEIVRTSLEAGNVYFFADEVTGNDLRKIQKNLEQRFDWIWDHDIEVDAERAEAEYMRRIRN